MIGLLKFLVVVLATAPFVWNTVKHVKIIRNQTDNLEKISLVGISKWIMMTAVVFVLAITVVNAFVIIPAGNRGVVFSQGTGVEKRILQEGFTPIIPIYESVHVYNIQRTTVHFKLGKGNAAASNDAQDVFVEIIINYRPRPDKVNQLWQEVGDRQSLEQKIIGPEVTQVLKAIIPKYQAQDVIIKREEIRHEALTALNTRPAVDRYAEVFSISLTNVEYKQEFRDLLERKAQRLQELQIAEREVKIAEQKKKKAIIDAEAEAQSKKVRADGEAYQNRVLAESVTEKSLESRKVDVLAKLADQWTGDFPATWVNFNGSGNMPLPLLSLDELMKSNIETTK